MNDTVAIERRIADLKAELGRVEGTTTEVYSRIVGYYRSVRNWNAGKRDEYAHRLTYRMPLGEGGVPAAPKAAAPKAAAAPLPAAAFASREIPAAAAAPREAGPTGADRVRDEVRALAESARHDGDRALSGDGPATAAPAPRAERSGMLVFTRKACPNCPPVAAYMERSGLPAVFVDVDAEEGLSLARRHNILSTPTVLGLDGEGKEAFRAHGLGELKAWLEPAFELV